MAQLMETTFQDSAPERIDESNGVLYGVKLLGLRSENGPKGKGRYYPESVCKAAVPLYEGAKGYANHPSRKSISEDRDIRDWAVVYQNPRFVEGSGIHGDAHLLKSDPLFNKIVEAAKRFPKSIGFSHVADGDTKVTNGAEIVENIKKVFSVDIVSDPATTNGLFESKQRTPDTLQEFIAEIPSEIPDAQRTKLIEAITAAWPVSGGPTANPEFQITLALLNSVQELARSIVDANSKNAQADADAAAAKATADKQAADKAAADKAKADNPGANVPPTLEAMQRRLDLADAKAMLLESGRAAKDEKVRALQIETLADIKGDDKRKSLLESWPKAAEAKQLRESRPFDRPSSSPPANSGGDGGGAMSESLKSVLDQRRKTLQEGKVRQYAY